ncbi:MAG: GH92 family glycosyl hydrolase [Dysgonamonadaceae bacterium]|jgi:predicted alpha-1,2-mannosidase|nr:GH92 family glycosyl hydrolase [Dysgonamonadaceae bacterium]
MKQLVCTVLLFLCVVGKAQEVTVWEIGKKDLSAADLALGPSEYKQFLAHDFGYEDGYYLVGVSEPKTDFPYVLPGPDDTWGGTWSTSGWRTHEINILFGIEALPDSAHFDLVIDLFDSSPTRSLLKVIVNDAQSEKFLLKGVSVESLKGGGHGQTGRTISLPLQPNMLKPGGNKITLTVLEGSWIVFDAVRLQATGGEVVLERPDRVFIRNVRPASYEITEGKKRSQPLLVDLEHLKGRPQIEVLLDGRSIFHAQIDTARYLFEAPMPAVAAPVRSVYSIRIDGKSIATGSVARAPQPLQTTADYVDTKMGTAHSRWMIAPGPWMPFSMVKLSPDNQNRGWQAGYQPTFETLGCFSHIHEWTMAGLGMMPTNGALQTKVGDQFNPDSGYRSRIDKMTEEAPLGYYKVHMTDTDILAEATATTRCSFQRYTFPNDKDGRVMVDLHVEAEYDYLLTEVKVDRVGDYRIEGYSRQLSPRPHVWSNDADQQYTVYFVMEFDRPIKNMGGWVDGKVIPTGNVYAENIRESGAFVEFDTKTVAEVQVRTGISVVSLRNASENLAVEIAEPFGWDFQAVVAHQKAVWNEIFSRVLITTNDRLEKIRFYTNMYRALCRNTWSDVNGEWVSAGGTVRRFSDPAQVALGCDAFWNTFWNLNQFWNLVTPEWSSKWVNSQLGMYEADGWLAKGPAGMKYIPVMVAEHEIPLIVGAYQMGIRDFDTDKALEAMVKMQTTPATAVAGGFAGNRDLITYLRYRYVPSDSGRFSNTLEYAFDDWTVSQFAKALGKTDVYHRFAERGAWWKNAVNPQNGYAHLRESNGRFVADFDPFRSGANEDYVEGNAWQLSYFVPQDVPGLIEILGEKAFVERLDWGFTVSEAWRYNAPNDQYWDYPVIQGNQQSMHFAFLFNWAHRPWLTQRWTRSIIDRYYGCGLANAYLGDEDQGQMSAWLVMASLGIFQTDGGCSASPVYEIASPLYTKTVINLGNKYGRGRQFVIEARHASRKNKYVQRATLNGKALRSFRFPASELLKGGSLILEMGDRPNTDWGIY